MTDLYRPWNFSWKIASKNCAVLIPQETKFEIKTSVYTTLFSALTRESSVYGESVFLETIKSQKLHRILSSPSFYGANKKCKMFDIIMVQNDRDAFNKISTNSFPVQFAKALWFIKRHKAARKFKAARPQNLSNGYWGFSFNIHEYCFVQFLETLSDFKFEMGWIDILLNRMLLNWQYKQGKEGMF